MNRIKILIAAVAIIALGIGIAVIFYATRPKAERKKPPRMTPVVQAEEIFSSDRNVQLELMGTVIPAQSVELKSRVPGKIVFCHPDWIEGGLLGEGQTIIRLENTDYRIVLEQAQNDLSLELGRQDIAKREWALLDLKNASDRDRELALREPQLKSAKARVEQAQLNFDRTEIKAPFNAIVTARNMNRGDQATTQSSLGRIVNTDSYHVRISVPVEELKWIDFPENGTAGSEVLIHLPDGTTRQGQVIKLLGDLEEKGRMARCLVEVKDPLNGESQLLLNSFVNVSVKGKPIKNVYCIDRNHFRENSMIWLLTGERRLRKIEIQPLWTDRNNIFFRADIPAGDMLITSSLSVVIDNMELRLEKDKKPEDKQGIRGEKLK
ncbi:efflux RND transporter periplasmic adaptor subunit [Verrucomicrobiota bacterium]